mmetsp:Transcript_24403/g.34389  ORF Transcript_24403/g.34389 Transcript_24403/m.34389 type:complete len:246 (-) Transcript_24403:175-912(-)
MQTKASQRNPDEFYFGMRKAEVRDGHHKKTRETQQEELKHVIGPEAVRIMKDQDLTYVRMQKQKDAKKIERLQASLHFLGGGDENVDEYDNSSRKKKRRKHTIFVQSKKDAETFDVAEHFDTVPEMADRAFNRPRASTLRHTAISGFGKEEDGEDFDGGNDYKLTEKELKLQVKLTKRTAKKVAKARSAAYGEMEARAKRLQVMKRAESHLVLEKDLAGKGRKRKVKGGEDGKPAVYKWRRKRLR